VIEVRLIGTRDEVQLALHRLRQCFATVTASEPRPSRKAPGQVLVYANCTF
jgi:hypothetical protein